MSELSITSKALNRKTGMTLEEVAAVIQRAYRLDYTPTATVKVEVGFKSQVQTITITEANQETPQ